MQKLKQKEQAKKAIRNAFLGLGVILGAVLILNTINPQLTNLEALNMSPLSVSVKAPFAEGVPTHSVTNPLGTYEGETRRIINCAGWDSGQGCDTELAYCLGELNGNPRSQSREGFVLCYIDDETQEITDPTTGATTTINYQKINEDDCLLDGGYYDSDRKVCYAAEPETCNGFFDNQTAICYPAEDRIDLGQNFLNQPARVREQECLSRGGIYQDPYCYSPE